MFDSRVVLVAEQDERWRAFVAAQLTADGAEVYVAQDVVQARARAATHDPDVVILGRLDDGPAAAMSLLRTIRCGDGLHGQPTPDLPVLAMLEDDGELAVLRAFDAGADDVTSRSVSYPVLRARLSKLIGRPRDRTASPMCRVGELAVDRAARQVRLRGRLVELSAKEFALLSALAADPSRVFTKDELLRDVWAFRSPGRTRTLDSHACRLRAKLGAVAGDRYIVNVWGVGYCLTDSVAAGLREVA